MTGAGARHWKEKQWSTSDHSYFHDMTIRSRRRFDHDDVKYSLLISGTDLPLDDLAAFLSHLTTTFC